MPTENEQKYKNLLDELAINYEKLKRENRRLCNCGEIRFADGVQEGRKVQQEIDIDVQNELFKCNNTAVWAKGQIKILEEMYEDRLAGKIERPVSIEFMVKELKRIRKGIQIMGSNEQ